MPITLSTLFTTPNDIWDMLSVEGVDLRQDDHNLATGQIIQVSADAIAGATSITTLAIPVALLRGATLVFDGGSMSNPVQVVISAAAAVGSTSLSVVALSDSVNSGSQARDSGVNVATANRMLVGARKGTSRIKLYCNSRYDDSELVKSGTVLDWATLVACKFLCERRAQGCPKGMKVSYDEMMEELRMVSVGQLQIEDIGTRGTDWPSMTNITVSPGYSGMQARVEPQISEQTPTVYGQWIDWNSVATLWC